MHPCILHTRSLVEDVADRTRTHGDDPALVEDSIRAVCSGFSFLSERVASQLRIDSSHRTATGFTRQLKKR